MLVLVVLQYVEVLLAVSSGEVADKEVTAVLNKRHLQR